MRKTLAEQFKDIYKTRLDDSFIIGSLNSSYIGELILQESVDSKQDAKEPVKQLSELTTILVLPDNSVFEYKRSDLHKVDMYEFTVLNKDGSLSTIAF